MKLIFFISCIMQQTILVLIGNVLRKETSMAQKLIGSCPVCSNPLTATRLTCRKCGLELSNDFTLNRFSYLTEKEMEFLEVFIKTGGNLKEIQMLLHLSYPSVKKQLLHLQAALHLQPTAKQEADLEPMQSPIKKLPIYKDESLIVQTIKDKLNAADGTALIPLPKGGTFHIYYEEFGTGLLASNLPKSRILTWTAFDCAMKILTQKAEENSRVRKGNAMKGKLGSSDLPIDSLEGYVAHYAYGAKKGDSCLCTVSALCAILDWTGLARNGYGYITLC